jgi:hypothetical protein
MQGVEEAGSSAYDGMYNQGTGVAQHTHSLCK